MVEASTLNHIQHQLRRKNIRINDQQWKVNIFIYER